MPDDLKPIFDDLVTDYRFAATKHHGSPFVSYVVLAEMVKLGWRLGAEQIRDVVEDISEHADIQGD